MNKMEKSKHNCTIDTELNKATWLCEEKDLLCDIKFFMREYYVGFYDEDGENLIIHFNNGQKFSITVREIK